MMVRLASAGLVLCAVACATPAPAQEMYDTSLPSEMEVVDQLPEPMFINFLEGIWVQKVELLSADGKQWPVAWTPSEEDVSKVEFRPAEPLPPGSYEIRWWAYVRQHYHPDGGVIPFTIAAKAAGASEAVTPAAAAPRADAPPSAPDLRDRALPAIAAPRGRR
jgi:methionine-rich copper-binding protein CopC